MKPIATLTLNPVIDVSCQADEVRPTDKIRTYGERTEPGGGGINVARALCGFEAPVHAVYLKGGISGRLLDELLELRCLERTAVQIGDDTRTSLNVRERATGLEYRFVPEGPEIEEAEWQACLDAVRAIDCDYFVASGSLARGLPDDAYALLAKELRQTAARFVLDTSGPELSAALEGGGLFLIKPGRDELEGLVGRRLPAIDDIAAAAQDIARSGAVEHVAVTAGREGAVLANPSATLFLPAVPVEACSAVGAGDSFLAAMTYAFARGDSVEQAFRLGIAAGAAAVQAAGPELCTAAEVERLLPQVPEPQPLSVG